MESKDNKKKIIIGGIIVVLVGVIIALVVKLNNNKQVVQVGSSSLTIATTEELQQAVNEVQDRGAYLPGYQDFAAVSSSYLVLRNPEENDDIYLAFRILNGETGDVLMETDLVKSGEELYWYPCETLEAGTYNIVIEENPYYQVSGSDNWAPLMGTSNSITVEVRE